MRWAKSPDRGFEKAHVGVDGLERLDGLLVLAVDEIALSFQIHVQPLGVGSDGGLGQFVELDAHI